MNESTTGAVKAQAIRELVAEFNAQADAFLQTGVGHIHYNGDRLVAYLKARADALDADAEPPTLSIY
jgi:hypothetical protein